MTHVNLTIWDANVGNIFFFFFFFFCAKVANQFIKRKNVNSTNYKTKITN
jgi:hypothetical protein